MLERQSVLQKKEQVVLIGLVHSFFTEAQVLEYLKELEFLADTAGAVCKQIFYQKLPRPDGKTFIGSGKLEEIALYVKENKIDLVIFDDELSGAQIRNIQEILKIKIIDRPTLILDIFAKRARTAQAKVQVELAQYQYLLPRLKGLWKHLERQGGGIGSRGPGETEIETDRRIIQTKISQLKKELLQIEKQLETQRSKRAELIRVGLIGYTNVGKSTLMNLLSNAKVLAENKLFATLDTTTRKVFLNNTYFLLSDTVGFIRKLPHHLIESFKSTLYEAKESDILLHVIDLSHPQYEDQIKIVHETLKQLNIDQQQIIMVFNKLDLYIKNTFDPWIDEQVKSDLFNDLKQKWQTQYKEYKMVFISAEAKQNIDELKQKIYDSVVEMYKIRYPYKSHFF